MRNIRFVIIPIRELNPEVIALGEKMWESEYTPIILYTTNPKKIKHPHITLLKKTGGTFNHWINQGITHAETLNPEALCVSFNSDMDILHLRALDPFFEVLAKNDLVGVSGWEDLKGGISPLRGHCFGIRAASGLRLPIQRGHALWWWQTDHLYYTALEQGKSIAFADFAYTHVSDNAYNNEWNYPEEFAHSAQKDHDWYWAQHWERDPMHESCYWNNWPNSIPEGQEHITQWDPKVKELKASKGEMKIAGKIYPIFPASELLDGVELFWKFEEDLDKLKPRNPSLTFSPEGELLCLLPAAKYAIKPSTTPEATESYLTLQEGENDWNTRVYYINLSEGHTEPPREVEYDNHECYDPRLFYDEEAGEYRVLLHNHISKKQVLYTFNPSTLKMVYHSKLNVHKRGPGLREKNWMRLPGSKGYIVHWDTTTNLSSGVFTKIRNNPEKYEGTRGGGNVCELDLGGGQKVLVAITHKVLPREGKLPIYVNHFTFYNPITLKIEAQTPPFKFSQQIVEFTSGLALDDKHAYVGYGVSDWWAEVTRLPIETLRNLYQAYKDTP